MSSEPVDPDIASRQFAREALEQDDATGWFERLYSAAQHGQAVVPWDRGSAHVLLDDWVEASELDGTGKTALVVGAGTGWDAELVADLGYETTAFDISPTAVETAKRAHPDSKAKYEVADLLDPPAEWHRGFDLVVEIYTVQALPVPLQAAATRQVGELVGSGGILLVIAAARDDNTPDSAIEGPPWPLTRPAMEAFATGDLRLIQLDKSPSPSNPHLYRWRGVYLRD